jgi:hypothetical protein
MPIWRDNLRFAEDNPVARFQENEIPGSPVAYGSRFRPSLSPAHCIDIRSPGPIESTLRTLQRQHSNETDALNCERMKLAPVDVTSLCSDKLPNAKLRLAAF